MRALAYSAALTLAASLGIGLGDDVGRLPPSASEVVQRMLEMNQARFAALRSYSCLRRYVAANPRFSMQAEVIVQEHYQYPGKKQLTILSEKGSPFIRDNVIRKMINTELDSQSANYQDESRIGPENYSFQWVGSEVFDSRQCFVLQVTPRASRKLLMNGQIWVDSGDFAIARMEGSPAKAPSFWTSQVHFVRTYQKLGQFWLPESMVSQSDVFLAGRSSLRITYYGYQIQPVAPAPAHRPENAPQ